MIPATNYHLFHFVIEYLTDFSKYVSHVLSLPRDKWHRVLGAHRVAMTIIRARQILKACDPPDPRA